MTARDTGPLTQQRVRVGDRLMESVFSATTAAVLVGGYALGCINFGYYLVRMTRNRDVRESGSHGTGATNVGRVLGGGGYLLTLILDAGKGAVAIALAGYFDLSAAGHWAVAFATIAGHVWPVQLRFRGGRGVATWIGTLAMLDPVMLLITAAVTLLALRPIGRFTLAGLVGICVVPIAAFVLARDLQIVIGTTALAAIVLIAHRPHLRRQVSSPNGNSTALHVGP